MDDSRTLLATDEAELLGFTPVPTTSNRYDGWTPRRQRDFITALALTGTVQRAVRAVGMSRQSAYKLRERPGAESFAAAWDIAQSLSYDRVFALAMDRAVNGITIPRYYKGRQIGTIHRPDLRLAMAVLAERPHPPGKGGEVDRMNRVPRNFVNFAGSDYGAAGFSPSATSTHPNLRCA